MKNEELYKVYQGAKLERMIGEYGIYSAQGFAGLITNGHRGVAYYKTEIGFRQTVQTIEYVHNYVNGKK